jgi:hypothetical protein
MICVVSDLHGGEAVATSTTVLEMSHWCVASPPHESRLAAPANFGIAFAALLAAWQL